MPEGATQPKPAQPSPDAGHIPITEEMDSAKWTLPPLLPVLVVVVVLGAAVIGLVFLLRPKPGALGAVMEVHTAELPDKTGTFVLIQVRVNNLSSKPIWLREIKAQLKTDQGEWTDNAASSVDLERYFKAFPNLGLHRSAPLAPEAKIAPGEQTEGMVLVLFPVKQEAFDKRKSLTVTLENYDRRPMVIAETP